MREVRLRPMTSEEFTRFRADGVRSYAAANVKAGAWPADEALALSAAEFGRLLPDGEKTQGQLLRVGLSEAGEHIGYVWISVESHRHGPNTAFLYDIVVDEPSRGQGYGRALLAAAEREAVSQGLSTLALSVFGQNHTARALYERSGYEISSLQLRKSLR